MIIDITAEQRREHAAALLAEAGRVLAAPGAVEQRLTAVAELAVGDLGERATVWLRTDDGRLHAVAAAPEHVARRMLALDPVAAPPSLEAAYRAGEPFVVPEVTDAMSASAVGGDPRRLAELEGLVPRSLLVAPLLAAGQLVGLLALSGVEGRRFDEEDVRLAGELGQRIATMVDAERLAARQRAAHDITVALSAAGTVAEASARLATGLHSALGAELVTVCTVGRDGQLQVSTWPGRPTACPRRSPRCP